METLKKLSALITADGALSQEEVAKLRAELYADGKISTEELAELFEIKSAVENGNNCPEWEALFVEAGTDALLEDGVVDSKEADLLISLISDDGMVDDLELALLLNILSKASSCDEKLIDFALEIAKSAVLEDRKVDAEEVKILEVVIFGSGSEGGTSVSKKELDFLFRLHEATVDSNNSQEWADFFVKAGTSAYLEDGVLDEAEAADLISRIGSDGKTSQLEKALAKNILAKATSVAPTFKTFIEGLA